MCAADKFLLLLLDGDLTISNELMHLTFFAYGVQTDRGIFLSLSILFDLSPFLKFYL